MDPSTPCFLNGSWLTLGEAKVSVLDRGFLFGDGVYEVVPVYSRRPFGWAAHQARLNQSLKALALDGLVSDLDWSALVDGLIGRLDQEDQFIYCQVTRGVARRDHAYPRPPVSPTVFATTSPLSRPSDQIRRTGLSAIRLPDQRWGRCDIKSIALLGNVMAREAAVAAGADEAILFRDGQLTEGAASNIWVVQSGVLLAPPRSTRMLEGIRMSLVESLARTQGISMVRREITEAEVLAADELLLSSATKELLPITRLDQKPVGNGQAGPVFQQLSQAYDQAIAAHRLGQHPA